MNERELFEEVYKNIGFGYEIDTAWACYQAGRAPLLKRIEELEKPIRCPMCGNDVVFISHQLGGTEK